jgi:hypothetical protein
MVRAKLIGGWDGTVGLASAELYQQPRHTAGRSYAVTRVLLHAIELVDTRLPHPRHRSRPAWSGTRSSLAVCVLRPAGWACV